MQPCLIYHPTQTLWASHDNWEHNAPTAKDSDIRSTTILFGINYHGRLAHNYSTHRSRIVAMQLWTLLALQILNQFVSPSRKRSAKKMVKYLTTQMQSVPSDLKYVNSSYWILGSGATRHIYFEWTLFTRLYTVDNVSVHLPNQSRISITLERSVTLSPQLELHDVVFIPTFWFNLIYLGYLLQNPNLTILFWKHVVWFMTHHTGLGRVIFNKGVTY